jgi:3-hydroxyacyl-CoA dehydrogenase/enoyl-CoA hydratase/3-hydroxybutyryl-CoA epimerase/enoyl-CoA isomerase
MAAAFPDRMGHAGKSAIEAMFEAERYGQKNGKGFYVYKPEKKGPPKKTPDPEAVALLAPTITRAASPVTDEAIVERMMIPMLLECSRCLEDRIVDSPVAVDIALLYGLGFPPFRGGIFRWADSIGSSALLAAAQKHAALGKLYEPTAQLKDLARKGQPFHAGE